MRRVRGRAGVVSAGSGAVAGADGSDAQGGGEAREARDTTGARAELEERAAHAWSLAAAAARESPGVASASAVDGLSAMTRLILSILTANVVQPAFSSLSGYCSATVRSWSPTMPRVKSPRIRLWQTIPSSEWRGMVHRHVRR